MSNLVAALVAVLAECVSRIPLVGTQLRRCLIDRGCAPSGSDCLRVRGNWTAESKRELVRGAGCL